MDPESRGPVSDMSVKSVLVFEVRISIPTYDYDNVKELIVHCLMNVFRHQINQQKLAAFIYIQIVVSQYRVSMCEAQ